MVCGKVKAALAECTSALELNPNLASAHYGFAFALGMAGRHDEALASVARAIRLSPFDPLMHAFLTFRSATLINLGRFAEAIEAARDAQRQPNHTAWPHMHEASALVNLGRREEGKAAMERAYAMKPDISMRWVQTLLPAEPGVDMGPYLDGMRKAGLRE
jgi:Flp pilus assembly protein TadD